MTTAKKRRGFSDKDLREVSDSPELTKADFAKAKPFAEVFPDLSASIRRGRGPNKAPTKKQVSLRLSPEVIRHFKKGGKGWQSRIDETLRKVVRRKAS
ncbi:BrnA antitoxin family protein [Bradyrhizobium sp.]|uniref:BrnA antitoxin family protein n=1 Tax=Bradyrhizobium sp. TaxID=376 RepID=UPI003BB185BE